MAMNPLFTVTFDLKSSETYGSFIDDLRRRFGKRGHFSHNRPVLPPFDETVPPRWWFHVALRTTQTTTLTLAIRADNLYLEGFRSSDNTWWELTQGFIPGATYMGFGGSYSDLLGETDAMVRVELGPQQMTEAVNVLAGRRRADKGSEAKQKQAGKMLATLLLMVNEATRFVTVSAFVAGLMHPKVAGTKSGVITALMKEQVNGWSDLSAALLRTDARPPVGFVGEKGGLTKAKAEKMGVDTEEKAANTVGVVLFAEDKTVKGMVTGAKALQLFPVGRLPDQ